MRLIADALEIKVGSAQRRSQQELGERALARGLAGPFLGRDDDGARLAVPGDDLGIGLCPLDHLREAGLGIGDRPVPGTLAGGPFARCHDLLLMTIVTILTINDSGRLFKASAPKLASCAVCNAPWCRLRSFPRPELTNRSGFP